MHWCLLNFMYFNMWRLSCISVGPYWPIFIFILSKKYHYLIAGTDGLILQLPICIWWQCKNCASPNRCTVPNEGKYLQVVSFMILRCLYVKYFCVIKWKLPKHCFRLKFSLLLQNAVDEVHRRNFFGLLNPTIDPHNPCLVLYVSRRNIVQDTITQLTKQGSCDFKKPLKVGS